MIPSPRINYYLVLTNLGGYLRAQVANYRQNLTWVFSLSLRGLFTTNLFFGL